MAHRRRVVVTGAAKSGIGIAVTEALLADGAQVIGSYQDTESDSASDLLTKHAKDDLSLSLVDHVKRDSLREFTDAIEGPIHGLVNGQFVFEMEDPDNYDYDLWDWLVAMNLSNPNFITRELEPKLVDGASVVDITSTEGFIGSFGGAAYAACKAGVHNLVKTHANNFGARNIRVNAVAGGWIGGVEDTDEIFNMSRQITPLARLGRGDEVAATVMFLLSDSSTFVNGTVLTVDGGYTGVDTLAKYEFQEFKKGQADG